MTTPGDQVRPLRTAIERQRAAQDRMRQTAEDIARERAQPEPAEREDKEEE